MFKKKEKKIVHGGKRVTVLSVGPLWCLAGQKVHLCTVLVCESQALVTKVQVRNDLYVFITST